MGEATGRFRRSDRLLDSRDFRRVLRRGRRRAHRDLVVITAPKRNTIISSDLRGIRETGGEVGSRIGITASRKVGGAVVRNLFKRRMREWFRARRSDIGPNLDLVVIARRSGAGLSLNELDERLSKLLEIDASRAWARRKVPGGEWE